MRETITYLNFDGNCAEAMKFYGRCLGGELYIMPFSEVPGDTPDAAKTRTAHASVLKGGRPVLMASDTLPDMPLFLANSWHVPVPLEPTYQATWDACPEELRVAVETGVLPEVDE